MTTHAVEQFRTSRAVLLFLLALLASLAAVLTVSSAADASHTNGHLGVGAGGGGGGGGSNGPGSGGSGGSGGGGCTELCNGPVTYSTSGTVFFPGGPPAPPAGASGFGGCGTTPWGPQIGVSYYYTWTEGETEGFESDGVSGSASYSCIDPPAYNDVNRVCSWDSTGALWGPVSDGQGPVSLLRSFGTINTPFKNGGGTVLSQCTSEFSYSFSAYATDIFGVYRLDGGARARNCTVRDYYTADARTGSVPADYIISCFPPYDRSDDVAFGTRWCGGWDDGNNPNGRTFTQQDCMGPTGRWNCVVPGPGITPPARSAPVSPAAGLTVRRFADGKQSALVWTAPQLSGGVRNVHDRKSRLNILSAATPYKGAGTPAGQQPFAVDPGFNTWLDHPTAGDAFITGWPTRWYGPSTRNSQGVLRPWLADVTYGFAAEFRDTEVRVVGFDTATGLPITAEVEVWRPDTGLCSGSRITIEAVRANNTAR